MSNEQSEIERLKTNEVLLMNAESQVEQFQEQIKQLESKLAVIKAEWERQKGLFPELSKDGWMDLALK